MMGRGVTDYAVGAGFFKAAKVAWQGLRALSHLRSGNFLKSVTSPRITNSLSVNALNGGIEKAPLGLTKATANYIPQSTSLNITPKNFFGNKTYAQIEHMLINKFGLPRGVGRFNKSFFNSKTGRTFNLHHDPMHRGGKPHIDIRKRGLDTNCYKNKSFFLKE